MSPPSRKVHYRKLPGLPESDDEGLNDKNDDEWISPDDALKLVRDPDQDTFAPLAVEKLVWQRISRYGDFLLGARTFSDVHSYPTALGNHVHVTKAWIPVDIAKALAANPFLVQRAVETFYTRDAIQLRVCLLFTPICHS